MKNTPVKRQLIKNVIQDLRVLVQTDRVAADVRSEFDEVTPAVFGDGVNVLERRADGDMIVFVGRLKI